MFTELTSADDLVAAVLGPPLFVWQSQQLDVSARKGQALLHYLTVSSAKAGSLPMVKRIHSDLGSSRHELREAGGELRDPAEHRFLYLRASPQ